MRSLFALSDLVTAGKVTWTLPRHVLIRVENYVATRQDVENHLAVVIRLVNEIGGPQVCFDHKRACHGLVAERDYAACEVVTQYGGQVCHESKGGHVVQLTNGLDVDGFCGFQLKEKGRWINKSSHPRAVVNVALGRKVRTILPVTKGDWFLAANRRND